MPDLGKYAAEVALAYGATIVLVVGLLVLSITESRRIKRALDETEARTKDG